MVHKREQKLAEIKRNSIQVIQVGRFCY